MRATRFYFADGAATGYARSLLGSEQSDALSKDIADIIEQLNYGLMMIVVTYIQRRGMHLERRPNHDRRDLPR
jgi:hypothetical protein